MPKDLQKEVAIMIYNYSLGVGPDAGTLAARIISKIKRQLGQDPRCPKCFEIMYDDDGKYQCVTENCENCR